MATQNTCKNQLRMTFSEAKDKMSDSRSGLKLVSLDHRITLPPRYIQNVAAGVREQLNAHINVYDESTNGLLVAYTNVKAQQRVGTIIGESPYIHFKVHADAIYFQPQIGFLLKGMVNKLGKDHIGCLMHEVFNVSLPKPKGGIPVAVGQGIVFEVTQVAPHAGILSIEGRLDHIDYSYGKRRHSKSQDEVLPTDILKRARTHGTTYTATASIRNSTVKSRTDARMDTSQITKSTLETGGELTRESSKNPNSSRLDSTMECSPLDNSLSNTSSRLDSTMECSLLDNSLSKKKKKKSKRRHSSVVEDQTSFQESDNKNTPRGFNLSNGDVSKDFPSKEVRFCPELRTEIPSATNLDSTIDTSMLDCSLLVPKKKKKKKSKRKDSIKEEIIRSQGVDITSEIQPLGNKDKKLFKNVLLSPVNISNVGLHSEVLNTTNFDSTLDNTVIHESGSKKKKKSSKRKRSLSNEDAFQSVNDSMHLNISSIPGSAHLLNTSVLGESPPLKKRKKSKKSKSEPAKFATDSNLKVELAPNSPPLSIDSAIGSLTNDLDSVNLRPNFPSSVIRFAGDDDVTYSKKKKHKKHKKHQHKSSS